MGGLNDLMGGALLFHNNLNTFCIACPTRWPGFFCFDVAKVRGGQMVAREKGDNAPKIAILLTNVKGVHAHN